MSDMEKRTAHGALLRSALAETERQATAAHVQALEATVRATADGAILGAVQWAPAVGWRVDALVMWHLKDRADRAVEIKVSKTW